MAHTNDLLCTQLDQLRARTGAAAIRLFVQVSDTNCDVELVAAMPDGDDITRRSDSLTRASDQLEAACIRLDVEIADSDEDWTPAA